MPTRATPARRPGDKVAALPFLVEMFGPADAPTYVVTKVGAGLDAAFKPGVVLEYWNGVPIDRAVQRHADEEVGGRPDSQRAWAVQSLTLRSLQYGPPPDEYWVVVGYRTRRRAAAAGAARRRSRSRGASSIRARSTRCRRAARPAAQRKALRRTRAVDPAAAAVRRAKMLLFAPERAGRRAGRARAAAGARRRRKRAAPAADVIATELTDTLKASRSTRAGGAIGYLRIYGFDTEPEIHPRAAAAHSAAAGRRPDHRRARQPGRLHLAAETRAAAVHAQADPADALLAAGDAFTREMAALAGMEGELGPWKESLEAAVRNGELYSQPLPITDRRSATRSASSTAGRSCWSATRRPTRPATCSPQVSWTTASARSSASARPPVPAAPTSGTTRTCARRWPARRRAADAARRHRHVVLVPSRDARRAERRPADRGRRHRRDALRDDARRPARRQRAI